MKKVLAGIAVLAVAITVSAFITTKDGPNLLPIGASAPMVDYKMADIDGATYALQDLKQENGLLVIFSCNTCPFVLGWEDRYPPLGNYCKENHIGMVAINSNEAKRKGDDSMEEMQKHASAQHYNFNYVIDENSQLSQAFGATKTPQCFLFDANMQLVYTGAIDDNMKEPESVKEHYLKNAIKQMMAGTEVSPNTTRAIGCSIKKL